MIRLILILFAVTFLSCANRNIQPNDNHTIRNINNIWNDSFYYKQKDTIYKAVQDAKTKQVLIIGKYWRFKNTWITCNEDGKLIELGDFKKEEYNLRILFRGKLNRYKKVGQWFYMNSSKN